MSITVKLFKNGAGESTSSFLLRRSITTHPQYDSPVFKMKYPSRDIMAFLQPNITGIGRKAKKPTKTKKTKTKKPAKQQRVSKPKKVASKPTTRKQLKRRLPHLPYVRYHPSLILPNNFVFGDNAGQYGILSGAQLPTPRIPSFKSPNTEQIQTPGPPTPIALPWPSDNETSEVRHAIEEDDNDSTNYEINKTKWNIDEVLDFLIKLPSRIRKTILVGLFGTAVGAILDILFGSPLGLTSKIIRGILRIIPGGWIILGAFDGIGYLLGKGKDLLSLPYDPSFNQLAQQIKTTLPEKTAEQIALAADRQLGVNTFTSTLAALAHAVFLRLSNN
uniref:P32K n=1 Tax=Zoothera dauma adenovirus TaxID=3073259 RepID=A0AA51NPH8_9ADEN|nr:p32K [Zoothera dauma adenovirus]